MTKATDLIAAERERQVTEEGYAADHDAGHERDLVQAAKCYAEEARFHIAYPDRSPGPVPVDTDTEMRLWPWADQYWKPTGDPVRDLVKAGALIAAAIDSLAGPVHNHGPAEGRGLDCGERRLPNGLLRGWCLASESTVSSAGDES